MALPAGLADPPFAIAVSFRLGDAAPATVGRELGYRGRAKLAPSLTRDFRPVVTAFRNWNAEIMAYFDHPQTNAYLESVNSLIAALDRNGRGYAFETIRAKALLSYGIHKASKPRFQRRPTGVTAEMIIGLDLDRTVNLGVDIDLLIAAISTPGALSGSAMLKRPINH